MDSQSAVAAYVSRDYSLKGEAYEQLLAALEDEADETFFKLSDHVGKMPPNLTPAMQRWYGAFVAGPRQSALDAVEAQAGHISKSKGAAGIFLERQLDAIEQRYPLHGKMIVIGHSMGGCISRLLMTDTGDNLWREIFHRPPQETSLPIESRALLSDALIFRHRPEMLRQGWRYVRWRAAWPAGWWPESGARRAQQEYPIPAPRPAPATWID